MPAPELHKLVVGELHVITLALDAERAEGWTVAAMTFNPKTDELLVLMTQPNKS